MTAPTSKALKAGVCIRSRELKLDRRWGYVWAIWHCDTQSKHHLEWERLRELQQLKTAKSVKLRCYRLPKPKKPECQQLESKTPTDITDNPEMRL